MEETVALRKLEVSTFASRTHHAVGLLTVLCCGVAPKTNVLTFNCTVRYYGSYCTTSGSLLLITSFAVINRLPTSALDFSKRVEPVNQHHLSFPQSRGRL